MTNFEGEREVPSWSLSEAKDARYGERVYQKAPNNLNKAEILAQHTRTFEWDTTVVM